MTEALDGFFSFLEHPKMRTDEPLFAAVAGAVAARRIGYVASARVEGDRLVVDPSVRIRFGQQYGADEFAGEDGAYLIAPEIALVLQEATKPSGPPEPPKPTVGAIEGPGPDPLVREPVPLPPPAPKGTKGTRYVVQAGSEGKPAWYKLAGAINELVGKSAGVTIKITVDARQPGGFDRNHLNLRVKEVLTEADGVEFKESLTNEEG